MNINKNIPLVDKTWFKTGGPARYFCEPETAFEFSDALAFAHKNNLPIFVLGCGANILISDAGFDGLVVRSALKQINLQKITNQEALVTAGAGVSMHDLIQYCLQNNIIGLEEFSGIPGTVGGSVYINLHYYEFLLERFLHNATVINAKTHEIITVDPQWFSFGYDQSKLQNKDYYLIDATFKLKNVSTEETAFARGRHVEIIRHRHTRYPHENTCGSFFRNFHDNEVCLVSNNKKMIYVAYYLDKVGVKGTLKIGNALVSYQHANMIVNSGSATSQEIINLARTMQELVYKKFNIMPQPECQLIGFKKYPLHK